LEEVQMPQNFIRHPGILALASALVYNPGLKILNFNDNTFTWRGSQAIAEALPKWQQLSVINFGDCLIRTKGAEFLAKALSNGHESLKVNLLKCNFTKFLINDFVILHQ
jgi:Ran GTPase-activating protein 1